MLAFDKQINILLNSTTAVKFICCSNISYFYIFIKKLLTVITTTSDLKFFMSKLSGSSHEEVFCLIGSIC